jgi:hypothetical protein
VQFPSYDVRGADNNKFTGFIYRESIENLQCWRHPINFLTLSGDPLRQPEDGTCRIFTVLQAHIILNSRKSNTASHDNLLITIVDIMAKLRDMAFVFVQIWDTLDGVSRGSSQCNSQSLVHSRRASDAFWLFSKLCS